MIHLFLTGGTGFFGRSLLRYGLHCTTHGKNWPLVTVLSRSPAEFLEKYPEFKGQSWLNFYSGNILQAETLPQKGGYTHVLHAATDSTLGHQLSLLDRHDQIVIGTRNMLNWATNLGIRRFLLTSSGGVYGPQPANMEKISEDWLGVSDPLNVENTYSIAKREAEHLCALYRNMYGLETIIARCFAFVGSDLPLDVHFAIGNFIRDALWGKEIVVVGDGTPLRSYLFQEDLAWWLIELLLHGQSGRVYNVGSDELVSIAELAYLVRDVLAPHKLVRILGEPDLNKMRNRYIPDITRVKAELGLDVRTPLAEAIKKTAELLLFQHNNG